MRRLTLAFSTSLVLVLAIAGTALGWHGNLASDCAPDANHYAWSINLPDESWNDGLVTFAWNEDFTDSWEEDFGSARGWQPYETARGGTTLWFTYTTDPAKDPFKTSANADDELCEPEGEPSVDLDKFVWDEGGLVSQITEGDPVTYTYEVTNDGETNLDIALLEDLITSSPEADPGDVACDDFQQQNDNPGNDDALFEPGETWVFTCTLEDGLPIGVTDNQACVYANVAEENPQAKELQDSDVFSCAEYEITVIEGDVGGGTGTPAASLPNSAVNGQASAPIATLAFGLLLLSSLGALAFVNVRSSARRR